MILEFSTHTDARGHLTFLEAGKALPFPVQLVYHISGVPAGAERGHHAHRALREVLIPVCGALTVATETAAGRQEHRLSRPDQGLLLEPGTWFVLKQFAPGTVLLVLASGPYDEAGTIRSYEEFRRSHPQVRQ